MLDGTVGKSLVKQYLAGTITLRDEDVQKLNKKAAKVQSAQMVGKDTLVIHIEDFDDSIQPVTTQGTSAIYNGIIGGERFYIKNVVKSQSDGSRKNAYGVTDVELAINELLASKIYTDVYGIDAIHLFLVINDKNRAYPRYMVASRAIEIDTCELISTDCDALLNNKIPGTIEPFLVDCILANWDIGSRGNVGILEDKKGKKAFRIDVGGSLAMRAMGQRRAFGTIPNEHEQFFQPSNKGYKLFKNVKTHQINDMFKMLENADMTNLDRIKQNLEEELNKLNDTDRRLAKNILDMIEVVKQRHQYYIDNKRIISSYLKQKVLQHRKE